MTGVQTCALPIFYLRLYDAPLRSEVCVWYLRKYKKIWVLSLGAENLGLNLVFEGRKSGLEFCV